MKQFSKSSCNWCRECNNTQCPILKEYNRLKEKELVEDLNRLRNRSVLKQRFIIDIYGY
jgi:hypothetical protein